MEVVASVLTQDGRELRAGRRRVPRRSRRSWSAPAASRPASGPGFPSDLVSLVTVLATQADGATLVHDWMYELRLFALEQMSGMGADLFLCDPHRIIVTGPRRLRGKSLDSRDIRSGMALIAAALAADGQSRVEPLETVERGYSRAGRAAADAGRDRSRRSERAPVWPRRLGGGLTGVGGAGGGHGRRQRRRRARASARGAAVVGAGGLGGVGSGCGSGIGSGGRSSQPARRRRGHAERLQILRGQVQHAHDPRRQRQDDVGFLRLLVVVARRAGRSPGCRPGRECPRATCAPRRGSGRRACWSRRPSAESPC